LEQNYQDAETRRNAIDALIQFITTHHRLFSDNTMKQVLNCFIRGCDDYAVDKRGDVGSFVRESSMKALQNLSKLGMTKEQVIISFI
jgi:hypothetical protein